MDKRYIDLFKEIAHATEVLAERVSEADYKDKTEDTDRAAQTLHDDFAVLYDKLRAEDFDDTTLTRAEFARLLVGVTIVTGNLETHIKELQTAVDGYKNRIAPMLNRVFNESQDDEGAQKLAQELFVIPETE